MPNPPPVGDLDELPRLAFDLLQRADVAVTIWMKSRDDLDGHTYRLRWANNAACQIYRAPLRELVGGRLANIFPSMRGDHIVRLDLALESSGPVTLGETVHAASERVFGLHAVGLDDRHVAVVTEDLTDARRTTAALERTAAELQDLYEHAPVGHHSIGPDGLFLRINDTALEWLGYAREELVGQKRFADILTPDSRATFAYNFPDFMATGVLRDVEFELIRKDGTILPVQLSSTAIRDHEGRYLKSRSTTIDIRKRRAAEAEVLRALEDIEDRVQEGMAELARTNDELRRQIAERESTLAALAKSEEQLRHAQKMEAVGRLAGGVAHDFNNMMLVVLGFTQLVHDELPAGDTRRDDLAQAIAAADRAALLTQQLLAFSRQQVSRPESLDLNAILRGVELMLQRLLGEQVQLKCRYGSVRPVRGDRGQIEQVVFNLAVNARDAMPDGGTLLIETAAAELDAEYAEHHYGVSPGPYTMIAVTDTGVGMSRETISRAFEPFFTTKDVGKGTGLGLSTVYGIVKQSGGHVWCYSEEGHGTTFKLYFPEMGGDLAPAPRKLDDVQPSALPVSGTILLVEDEDLVRAALTAVLKRSGFEVVSPTTATHALELVHTGRHFDLIITDVVMPEMSGPDLVEKIHALCPDMPALFVSGYPDHASTRHGVPLEAAFLQKPVSRAALERKIRELLGPRDGQGR